MSWIGVFTGGAIAVFAMASPSWANSDDDASCDLEHAITDEAEQKPGGALYQGNAMASHSHGDDQMADMDSDDMAGTHVIHLARHGGAFFMAPNKIHHLEAVYAGKCGFRVFFYNAFTEPIRANRFQAFIVITPTDEDELEIRRFLLPAHRFSILEAPIDNDLSRPFKADLYVSFPESDEPRLFTVHVPAD